VQRTRGDHGQRKSRADLTTQSTQTRLGARLRDRRRSAARRVRGILGELSIDGRVDRHEQCEIDRHERR
jgi:hypothetical protein